jgi:hypothetical protein
LVRRIFQQQPIQTVVVIPLAPLSKLIARWSGVMADQAESTLVDGFRE